jgi:hypothetical protein
MMSSLRSAHAVWLLRRAAILEGVPRAVRDEVLDAERAAIFHRVADRVCRATEERTSLTLTPEEQAVLSAEAEQLSERAMGEIRRSDPRDLERGEEWVRTARAFREIVEAATLT